MKRKVVVFGGCGFLGKEICNLLSKNKYDVLCIDKKIVKFNDKNKYQNLDILDKKKINIILKKTQYVFHFAGIADIEKANLDPIETINQNVIGTLNILDACFKNKVNRLFFASSIYIYSDKGGFYNISKQTCESLIRHYKETKNLSFSILRLDQYTVLVLTIQILFITLL